MIARKILFSIICFLSVVLSLSSNAQAKTSSDSLRTIINEINRLKHDHMVLVDSVASLNKSLQQFGYQIKHDDLIKTIEASNNVISGLSGYVNSFSFLLGFLAVIVTVVSIIIFVPVVRRIKRIVKRAENTQNIVDNRILNLDQVLDSRFLEYEKKQKDKMIDGIISDLSSIYSQQRLLAQASLAYLPVNDLAPKHIYKLFAALNERTEEDEQAVIVETLVQINSEDVRTFFKNWSQAKRKSKYPLIRFYSKDGISQYIEPIADMILKGVTPYLDYIMILGWLSSLGKEHILILINHRRLNAKLDDYSVKIVIEYLDANKNVWDFVREVDTSFIKNRETK